jgi:multicomponent Na+:H+ antiporter subunit D
VTFDSALPLLILASSLLPGLLIFMLREESHRLRCNLNLLGAGLKLVLVAVMLTGIYHGIEHDFRVTLLPGVELVLHADALSAHFATLSAVLWLATTLYAIGYLEESPHRSRFFGYFSLCVTSTVGIALSGNLFTFLVFYEMLTLATWPLVVHRGTEESRRAGRVYLAYTVGGGALLLGAIVWLAHLAGSQDFSAGGYLNDYAESQRGPLIAAFALLIAGFGVKAALVPLHSWLPQAMVAPAPVSALLHAVAVVKAGAFGIVRVVYEVYGVDLVQTLGVAGPLQVLAAFTILYGSLQALAQDEIKKRLAYSTVSQVSYIALGAALAGPIAAIGGIVHLVHQGLMKITLFFCAGNLAETLGIHKVRELDGVGRRMPWTMAAFTTAALGMIGAPPTAGFISKWYIGLGALEVGQTWVIVVLCGSSLLNAMYFLPLLYRAWFKPPPPAWPEEHHVDGPLETHWMLLLPPLFAAVAALLAGLLSGWVLSPLGWSRLVALREFGL